MLHLAPHAPAAPPAPLLAQIGFGETHRFDPRAPDRLQVGLPPLAGAAPNELWQAGGPVATGHDGEIGFGADGEVLLGHLLLEEPRGSDLDPLAFAAYRALLACCRAAGYPHLIRVWHYIRAINGEQSGLERYRSFCIGRHRALAAQPGFERTLPAACALGSAAAGLLISFLAAKRPGTQVENPRQVSAFRYPERYGPRSPSFSRACRFAPAGGAPLLFLSGTASITGHETRHAGDRPAQLAETCRNLDALLGADAARARPVALRAYVRDPADWPLVEQGLRAHFGAAVPLLGLHADICRHDLALEVDGLAVLPEPAP